MSSQQYINEKERIQLKKLMGSDFEDNTDLIRKLKHSKLLRSSITKLKELITRNASKEEMEMEKFNSCYFLFTYYTDIYNKIISDTIDIKLLMLFVDTLERIENEELDMNEGSVVIGRVLKEIYIDSALKLSEKLDKQHAGEIPAFKESIQISWKEYKKNNNLK